MFGQTHHFLRAAPEPVPYAIERYSKETRRLYGVLNSRLAGREFLGSEYSVADIATRNQYGVSNLNRTGVRLIW